MLMLGLTLFMTENFPATTTPLSRPRPYMSTSNDANGSNTPCTTHRTRSMPISFSVLSSSDCSRVQMASFPTQTPCSLAPISAPHIQAGQLSTTAWVEAAWSIVMYVHCAQKKQRNQY